MVLARTINATDFQEKRKNNYKLKHSTSDEKAFTIIHYVRMRIHDGMGGLFGTSHRR